MYSLFTLRSRTVSVYLCDWSDKLNCFHFSRLTFQFSVSVRFLFGLNWMQFFFRFSFSFTQLLLLLFSVHSHLSPDTGGVSLLFGHFGAAHQTHTIRVSQRREKTKRILLAADLVRCTFPPNKVVFTQHAFKKHQKFK